MWIKRSLFLQSYTGQVVLLSPLTLNKKNTRAAAATAAPGETINTWAENIGRRQYIFYLFALGAGPKRFDSIRQQQQQQSGSEDKKYQSSDDTGGDHIAVPFDFTKIRFSDHKSNRRESSTDCAFREQHRIFDLTDIIKLIARVVKVYKICISIRLTRVKEQAFIQRYIELPATVFYVL